ncbi:MAG: hypothetical protein Q9174_005550 [Haloplaca sp. 1 TL-2023]
MDERWSPNSPGRQSMRTRDPNEKPSGRRTQDVLPHRGNDRRTRRTDPPSQRGGSTRKSSTVASLEESIAELFETVNDAIHQFEHFDQDFQKDVHRLRSYCSERLIEAVWIQKVSPKESKTRDRRRDRQSRGDDDDIDGKRDDSNQSPGLRGTIDSLLEDLTAALRAADEYRPSQRNTGRYKAEDVSKIRQQLHRSYQNLRKSFSVLTERHAEMETVTTELEMFRLFLSRNGGDEGPGGAGPGGAGQGGADKGRMGGKNVRDHGLDGGHDHGAFGGENDEGEEWDGGQEVGQGGGGAGW